MKRRTKFAIIKSAMMMGFCLINPVIIAFYYTGWNDAYPTMHTTAAVLWGALIALCCSHPGWYFDRTHVIRINIPKTIAAGYIRSGSGPVFDEIQCYGLLSSHWDRFVVYKKFIQRYF